MNIPFWKMHGAGNDFILVDDREKTFPTEDTAWLARIGARHTGIGCDGIALIQPPTEGDFNMRFFNPDGNEAEMCGNAARCVAKLAHEIGAAPAEMAINTVAGIVRAEMIDDDVRLHMPPPKNWQLNQSLVINGEPLPYGFVNSGVPHVVVTVEDLDACDILAIGADIRYHNDFAPAGTNANFISVTGPQSLRIRTYERGVEAETLACGTGIVASALIAAKGGLVKGPVELTAAGNDTLTVDFTLTDDGANDVTLLGPATHVFQGELTHL